MDLGGRIEEVLHSIEILDRFRITLDNPKDRDALGLITHTPSIAVIGLVSRGKSTLVNRLIGAEILPTGPNPVTFGCGYISAGEPRAIGHDKRGAVKELPTDPLEFRHRARRHDAQDIIDFEYTGRVRLPPGVRLIDTKGLDEIRSKYDEDIEELEREWAEKGAVGAVVVSSVPPGASAQDVKLFRVVQKRFRDNTFVVLKQTDSSISVAELEMAASVWRQHRAKVLVVRDLSPDPESGWGNGPFAELEQQLSTTWSHGEELKIAALGRLESRIAKLLREIPGPMETTRPSLTRSVMWEVLEDERLPVAFRDRLQTLLAGDYEAGKSLPADEKDFVTVLRLVSFGSERAERVIRDSALAGSKLRRNVSLQKLLGICEDMARELDASELFAPRITNMVELREVLKFVSNSGHSLSPGSGPGLAIADFISLLETEESLFGVLEEFLPDRTEAVAKQVVARLLEVWLSDVDSGRRLRPVPDSTTAKFTRCLSMSTGVLSRDAELQESLGKLLRGVEGMARRRVAGVGSSPRDRIRTLLTAEVGLAESVAAYVGRIKLVMGCAEDTLLEDLEDLILTHGVGGTQMQRVHHRRKMRDAEDEFIRGLETSSVRLMWVTSSVAIVSILVLADLPLLRDILAMSSAGTALYSQFLLRRVRTEGLVPAENLEILAGDQEFVVHLKEATGRIRIQVARSIPGFAMVGFLLSQVL